MVSTYNEATQQEKRQFIDEPTLLFFINSFYAFWSWQWWFRKWKHYINNKRKLSTWNNLNGFNHLSCVLRIIIDRVSERERERKRMKIIKSISRKTIWNNVFFLIHQLNCRKVEWAHLYHKGKWRIIDIIQTLTRSEHREWQSFHFPILQIIQLYFIKLIAILLEISFVSLAIVKVK